MSEYGVAAYGGMIRDRRRIGAYLSALKRALPEDGVLCELGTGTGIVAFLALEAGARKVFAIEPADAIEVAREIARENGIGEDRIEFIQALSTSVELPEPADVLLSDMRGVLSFMPGHFSAIADARARLLKPGGVLISQRDTLFCALASAGEVWRRSVGMWDEAARGVDMSAARKITANQGLDYETRPDELLTAPGELGTIDYTTVDSPHFAGEVTLDVTAAGTAHAVPVWFDTTVYDDIVLSNAPGQPLLAYGRTAFPLEQPVDVDVGDRFTFRFEARLIKDSYMFNWNTRVTSADGTERARFDQSTFHGEALSVQSLRKNATSSRPRLNEDGRMYAFCYERMDGEHTLAQIAGELHAAFAGRFEREPDALVWVTRALDGVVE